MARAASEEVRRWVSLFVTRLRSEAAILNGHDLRQMGIPPGPRYKEILGDLLDARLNGRLSTREDEVAFVRRRFLKDVRREA
jgi:tRNA nucleotidyltransferase (CCA-adding enzyme)